MKQSRLLLWITILLIGLVAVLRFKHTHRAEPPVTHSPALPHAASDAPTTAAITTPPANHTPSAATDSTLAIEHGMTIDYSSGHAVVTQVDPEIDAQMRADLAEMEAAAAEVIFTADGAESAPEPDSATPVPAP